MMHSGLDKTQIGRAGELALSLYALITSDGGLEVFSPLTDDDHVDLVAGLRGGLPAIGLQVKTSDAVDAHGLVEARASFPDGQARDDPAFLYAIVLLHAVQIHALWIVPSPDFNRLAYRVRDKGRDVLEFRASPANPDPFARFLSIPCRSARHSRAASTLVESWFDAFTFAPRTFPAASCRTIRRLPFESLWSGLMLPEVMVVGLVLNCAPVSSSLPGLAAFWPSASRNPLLCPKMPTLSATAWPLIFTSSGIAALTFTLPETESTTGRNVATIAARGRPSKRFFSSA